MQTVLEESGSGRSPPEMPAEVVLRCYSLGAVGFFVSKEKITVNCCGGGGGRGGIRDWGEQEGGWECSGRGPVGVDMRVLYLW